MFIIQKLKLLGSILLLVCLSVSGVSAQTVDSMEMIIILPDTVNNNIVELNAIRTQLGARELGYTQPSNARLWRLQTRDTIVTVGRASIIWDGLAGAIDAVDQARPNIKSVGSENWEIVATQTTSSPSGDSVQNLGNLLPFEKVDSSIISPHGQYSVKIAVLDAGVQPSSVHLQPFIHPDSWNFISESADLGDKCGHGNFVSNIVRTFMKEADFLYVYKILNDTCSGRIFDAIQAIDRCSQLKMDVVNCSFVAALNRHTTTTKTPFNIAIDSARVRNVLVICAAGNDATSIDNSRPEPDHQLTSHYTPAAENNNNIITVLSVGNGRQKSTFSNYGTQNADLAAFGERILSYWADDVLQRRSGTSYAAPQVAGIALRLYSNMPQTERNYQALKDSILRHATRTLCLSSYCLTSGVINAQNTQNALNPSICGRSTLIPQDECAVFLAIKPTQFSGIVQDNKAVLTWVDDIRENKNEFVVEKSNDGFSFVKILTIKNNNQASYTAVDAHLTGNGIHYYRLLTVKGQQTDTSQTIALHRLKSMGLNVFPNPTQGNMTVEFDVMASSDALTLELIDVTGKIYTLLPSKKYDKGLHQISFDLKYPTGLYVCRLLGNQTIRQQKIIIAP